MFLINNVYLLDIVVFIYFLQFLWGLELNFLKVYYLKFLNSLNDIFSYSKEFILSSIISVFLFFFLLINCYGGYFSYSFSPCGMIEFTLFLSLISWFSTFLCFISSEKVFVYFSKGGDGFFKTLSMLIVEIVSEFSRPVALTVRLTVNIMVGHMISMSLFMFLDSKMSYFYIFSIFAIMMECFVFIIQSYIFSRLLFLYLNE